MNAHVRERQDYGFMIGMLAGTFVGAGLVMWLAPRGVRDGVADAVVRGAHEVERYATAAKSDRVLQTREHSAADHLGSTRDPAAVL